jgi:hypothetical protein
LARRLGLGFQPLQLVDARFELLLGVFEQPLAQVGIAVALLQLVTALAEALEERAFGSRSRRRDGWNGCCEPG